MPAMTDLGARTYSVADDRVARLEAEMTGLRERLDLLEVQWAEFRKQFE